jgi:hypothetical protein
MLTLPGPWNYVDPEGGGGGGGVGSSSSGEGSAQSLQVNKLLRALNVYADICWRMLTYADVC